MSNNSELFDFLPLMTEDERSLIFSLTSTERIVMTMSFILAVVWGSIMKFFLYYNITKEKISERPINILILLDQVIEHITNLYLATVSTLKVSVPVGSQLILAIICPNSNGGFRGPLEPAGSWSPALLSVKISFYLHSMACLKSNYLRFATWPSELIRVLWNK